MPTNTFFIGLLLVGVCAGESVLVGSFTARVGAIVSYGAE